MKRLIHTGLGLNAPGSAAKLVDVPRITWHDEDWLAKRAKWRPYDEPLNIYEVHLGSFIRDTNAGPDGGYMTYQDAIDKLIPYVQELGYTHIEFLPLMEHPLRRFMGLSVNGLLRADEPSLAIRKTSCGWSMRLTAGLGVIMDWVPGISSKTPICWPHLMARQPSNTPIRTAQKMSAGDLELRSWQGTKCRVS